MAEVLLVVAAVRVRILTAPDSKECEPFDVAHFQVGNVYDIGPRLAQLLPVDGRVPERYPFVGTARRSLSS